MRLIPRLRLHFPKKHGTILLSFDKNIKNSFIGNIFLEKDFWRKRALQKSKKRKISPPKEKDLTMFFSKKCFFYSFTQTNMKAKGFTLIELLVVITIIGILATGATALYTGAQQKARDSIRISEIQVVKSAVEQAYGDDNEYLAPDNTPDDGTIGTLIERNYLTAGPVDTKEGEDFNGTALGYVYSSADTTAGGTSGEQQLFEVSTGFESPGNIAGKATGQGDDDTRFEIGNNIDDVFTVRESDGSFDAANQNTVGGAATDAILLPAS